MPLIKTTVSFTDRYVYKWQILINLQTCRKAITPNQSHFNNPLLFVLNNYLMNDLMNDLINDLMYVLMYVLMCVLMSD